MLRFKDEAEFKAFLASRAADNSGAVPKSKSSVGTRAQGKAQTKGARKKESKAKYRIVVIAKRSRGIDPDNVLPKWYIDQLMEAGYLPDDSSKYVSGIEKRVEKVSRSKEETVIEIWREET